MRVSVSPWECASTWLVEWSGDQQPKGTGRAATAVVHSDRRDQHPRQAIDEAIRILIPYPCPCSSTDLVGKRCSDVEVKRMELVSDGRIAAKVTVVASSRLTCTAEHEGNTLTAVCLNSNIESYWCSFCQEPKYNHVQCKEKARKKKEKTNK